jgi:hypothetical protein
MFEVTLNHTLSQRVRELAQNLTQIGSRQDTDNTPIRIVAEAR